MITGILINQILFINQIFLNLILNMNKHDNQDKPSLQDKAQHHIIRITDHKTQ